MKFSRELIIKAIAAVIILAFVLELFVVMTYAPTNAQVDTPTPTPVVNTTVGFGSFNVAVKNFTPNLLFVCNSTASPAAALKGVNSVSGVPVLIGSTENGKIYSVRASKASETALAASEVQSALSEVCSYLTVLRQAEVLFNESKGVNFTIQDSNSSVFVSKYSLDAYRDQYGKLPSALISDNSVVEKSVISVQALAKFQANRIVSGSLQLEQVQSAPSVENFEVQAKVLSLEGDVQINFVYPWTSKNFDFANVERLNATVQKNVESTVIFNGIDVNLLSVLQNASGVIKVTPQNGKTYVSVLESYVDKSNFEYIANKYGAAVEFPTSNALIQVNSENYAAVAKLLALIPNAISTEYVQGTVEAINSSSKFSLGKFRAVLYKNVTVNDVVDLHVSAIVAGSNVLQVNALQN